MYLNCDTEQTLIVRTTEEKKQKHFQHSQN